MHIDTIAPQSAALRERIEFFYVLTRDAEEPDDCYQVFPHTHTFVSVHADARVVADTGVKRTFEPSPTENTMAWLYTSYMRPLVFEYRGRHTELTIGFKPHAVNAFLPKPLGAYMVDASQAPFSPYEDFLPTMRRALALVRTQRAAAVALLESYLLGKLKGFTHPWLQSAIADLQGSSCAEVTLHDLAQKFDLSPQNLSQQFKRYVGKSPSDFRKTIRFRQALDGFRMNTQTLTTLAHALGYYDQSHMTKDLRTITGLAPMAFFYKLTVTQGMDIVIPAAG